MRAQTAEIKNQINQRRHNHPANRTRDWEGRLPGGGQFTSKQFALDFEADQKKKNGHQTVVDAIVQAQRKHVRRNAECQRYLPQMVVSCRQRRIGNCERGKTKSQQDQTAKCLRAEKALKHCKGDSFQPSCHVSWSKLVIANDLVIQTILASVVGARSAEICARANSFAILNRRI